VKKEYSFGIIPLRFEDGKWEALLVQLHAGHWSFPKGHAEKEEKPIQTAERELFEETGLQVKRYVNDSMHQETYIFKHQDILIKKEVGYFTALVEGEVIVQEEEIKNWQWLSLVDCLRVLSFRENKKMISAVQQTIEQL